jgi:hypothetical protein
MRSSGFGVCAVRQLHHIVVFDLSLIMALL